MTITHPLVFVTVGRELTFTSVVRIYDGAQHISLVSDNHNMLAMM